jgi:uncharacterized protein YndB with AHSA1/START domain
MALAPINLVFNGCLIAQKKNKNMEQGDKVLITVQATINAPIEMVWKNFTTPDDIVNWNSASEDWHTTKAENDLQIGGKFNYRMEAKDGSFGFDFWGIYDEVVHSKKLTSTLGDSRKLVIAFESLENSTKIVEVFEAENENPIELQQGGWQAILDNFKKHVEAKK